MGDKEKTGKYPPIVVKYTKALRIIDGLHRSLAAGMAASADRGGKKAAHG